jgi:tRNA-modifying protein YgfZ
MYRLGQATILEIRGRDRSKVLNNVATQDLRILEVGQAFETFITETKGRSLGHGIAVGLPDRHLFVTVPGQGERLFAHLDRFIIMEDAVVKDISGAYCVWLVCTTSDFPESLGTAPGQKQSIVYSIEEESVIGVWAPWVGESSSLLLVPTSIEARLESKFSGFVVQSDLLERTAWEAERIANFWPWFGQDFDDKNLPQEVDRNDQAISFNKGCYLGQETIARLDALGQVQKKLVRLKLSTHVLPDLKDPSQVVLLSDGAEVGQLRSVAKDASGEVVGIGLVKRSHFASGTSLVVGQASIPAQIL